MPQVGAHTLPEINIEIMIQKSHVCKQHYQTSIQAYGHVVTNIAVAHQWKEKPGTGTAHQTAK